MSGVVVVSEHPATAAALVRTARELTTPDDVRVVALGGADVDALARTGATALVVLDGGADRPEAYAGPIADLVRDCEAELLLVGATVTGQEIAARVATELGAALVSSATGLRRADGAWSADRAVHAGAAVQTETWTGPGVVTVAPSWSTPAEPDVPCPVQTRQVVADTRVRRVGRTVPDRGATDLADAPRVVCVGMGLGSPEALPVAEDLAAALGAQLACTRPVAEDRGWLGTERYLGISGLSLHPDLYLGLGVSGQVQHSVGFRDAKVVAAVNSDPDAPIAQVADYLLVGDLHTIAPLLTAALRARDR
ncbi:MAG TPA: electron transfer flavoprotein subunit alpha/FixB family protein [Cellulomonas sp.]